MEIANKVDNNEITLKRIVESTAFFLQDYICFAYHPTIEINILSIIVLKSSIFQLTLHKPTNYL